MTRLRIHGEDSPCMRWVRENPRMDSRHNSIVVADVDAIFHRYRTSGDRKRQAMIDVEIKTNKARPNRNQAETLAFRNTLLGGRTTTVVGIYGTEIELTHFGVAVLSLSGTTPDDSSEMFWGRFLDKCDIFWQRIDADQLEQLLRCEIHPDTLEPLDTTLSDSGQLSTGGRDSAG